MSLVYGNQMPSCVHGGIVVVAPIATKPLLGGSSRTVPADTRSGFLILLSSTSAGALKLNLCAIEKRDSPDCTVYVFGTYVVVGPPKVVVVLTESSGADDVDVPLSVNSPLRIARAANAHVLHSKYM
jgi:hypothetical protein